LDPNVWGRHPKIYSLYSMPTDTRHVLKFRKDPYRGIDGLGSEKNKATFV